MSDICINGIYKCIHVGKYDNPPPLLPLHNDQMDHNHTLRPPHKYTQCPCIGWACEKKITPNLLQVVNQVETNGTKWTKLVDSGNIVDTLPWVLDH